MKKLNITKEQFNRSNYFQRKYGKLEYVSESGRLFKTNKGKVLKFINESNDQEEFSYKGVVITRYDYESLPMPMAASKLDDETMQKIAEDIYYMLLDHGWEDKDIDRYLGRNLDELEDENDRDANMIKEDFWEYMENAAVANGMEYYSEMEDGDEYMESRKSVKESFGMGFGDRFCDCESDPIEYNGQTYDTWTMYSGDDEIGDVMFADDALRQAMDEGGADPQIMEMVDLWVNPRDKVEDAIDQIIGEPDMFEESRGKVSKGIKRKSRKVNESTKKLISEKLDYVDSTDDTVTLCNDCPFCKKHYEFTIKMDYDDFIDAMWKYKYGAKIQDAFPNLTPDEREQIKTGICNDCWDSM